MKPYRLLLCALLTCFTSIAFAQKWQWANSGGGDSRNFAESVAVDSFGNTFITGQFSDTIYFKGGARLQSSRVNSADKDAFLAKYDPFGNLLWAKGFSGNFGSEGKAVAVDDSGNCFVAGIFYSDVNIDGIRLVDIDREDVFLAKFDPAGNSLWAKVIGTTSTDYVDELAVDKHGACYITCTMKENVNFAGQRFSMGRAKDFNAVIGKVTSNGMVEWVRYHEGSRRDFATGLAVDRNLNCFTAGSFENRITIDTVVLEDSIKIVSADNGLFLTKYDSSGSFQWAKAFQTQRGHIRSIGTDQWGNCYVAGQYRNRIQFGDTSFKTTASQFNEFGYLTKLDTMGKVVWAKHIYCDSLSPNHQASISIKALAVGKNGSSIITGSFQDSAVIDSVTVGDNNKYNDFMASFDSAGRLQWVELLNASINEIVMDKQEGYYLAGALRDTTYFGNDTLLPTTTRSGHIDVFVAKYGASWVVSALDDEQAVIQTIKAFPNPTSGTLNLEMPENSQGQYRLLNTKGQVLQSGELAGQNALLDFSNERKGLYLLELRTNEQVQVLKVVRD